MNDIQDRFGICQWFHYHDYHAIERTVELLLELGVRHLRTGISWADWHRPDGEDWYRWQMEQLVDFDVLLSIWHTPPSISESNAPSGPPRRLNDYAAFIGQVIEELGETFTHLELWNEPNNRLKWDFPNCDPQWEKFGTMVRQAGQVANAYGAPAVLGGIIPVDPAWLDLMKRYGAIEPMDVVAIHGFPEMWWDNHPNWDWYQHWHGWEEKIEKVAPLAEGRPVWITETGLATWDLDRGCEDRFDLQIQMIDKAIASSAERVYWYTLIDLDPAREAIEGFHVDENEYHLGLVRYDGSRKPAWDHVQERLSRTAEDPVEVNDVAVVEPDRGTFFSR